MLSNTGNEDSVGAARGLLKAAQDRKVADVVLLDQGRETDQELSSRRDEERPVIDASTPVGLEHLQMLAGQGQLSRSNLADFDQFDWSSFLRNMDIPIINTFSYVDPQQYTASEAGRSG